MSRRGIKVPRNFTVGERLAILDELRETTGSQTMIAKKYNIAHSTLATWKAQEEKMKIRAASHNYTVERLTTRLPKYDEVERAVAEWVKEMKDSGLEVNGVMIQKQAVKIAEEKGVAGFTGSATWLSGFRKRNDLDPRDKSHGINKQWRAQILPDLLMRYAKSNIYNVDEVTLLFKLMPNQTLIYRDKLRSFDRGAESNHRLTVLMACSATGEKLPLLVVGNSKTPSSFKGMTHQPVEYKHNTKSWMTSEIFIDWLRKFDSEMYNIGRKVALVLDISTAHPRNLDSLQAVELIFLPPFNTADIQPIESGIRKCFKTHYRNRLVQEHFGALLDANSTPPPVTVLHALDLCDQAWSMMSAETITSSFTLCNFVSKTSSEEMDPFRSIKEECDGENYEDTSQTADIMTKEQLTNVLKERGFDAELYVTIDDDIITSEYPVSDGMAFKRFYGSQAVSSSRDSDSDDSDEETNIPSSIQVDFMLTDIHHFVLSHAEEGELEELKQNVNSLRKFVRKFHSSNSRMLECQPTPVPKKKKNPKKVKLVQVFEPV